MIRPLRDEAIRRRVRDPGPGTFPALRRDAQTLFTPPTLHLLAVHQVSFLHESGMSSAIPPPRMAFRERT
jgi:hypothetical protein